MKPGHPARDLDRLDSRTSPRLKVCLLVSVVVVGMVLVFTTGRSVATAGTEYSSTPNKANASATSTTPYAATGYFYVSQKGNGWTLVTRSEEHTSELQSL